MPELSIFFGIVIAIYDNDEGIALMHGLMTFSTHKLTAATLVMAAIVLAAPAGYATNYFSDPAGKMENNGTSPATPWASLQTIFDAKPEKVFSAGDVIVAKAGFHGSLHLNSAAPHTGNVTIQADAKTTPMLASLTVDSPFWTVDGFDICGENSGAGQYVQGPTVHLKGGASHVTVQNCLIRGAKSIDGWTATEWNELPKQTAVVSSGTHSMFSKNTIQNVRFGFAFEKGATFSTFSRNAIREFHDDGMRGLADDCLFEYNTVMNSYGRDANHDDCFQSWSIGKGPDGKNLSGASTIYRNTLRGNILVSHTDANQPLQDAPQGIGMFDGMYEGWVIENNVISVSGTHWGIGILGAVNCTVINNTVVENAFSTGRIRPGITITKHKAFGKGETRDGVPWPPASTGNLIRNNISTIYTEPGEGTAFDHNLPATKKALSAADYEALFVDYAHADFRLKKGSPAIDAGSTLGAPKTDAKETPRTAPYDIGAYEFVNDKP